MFTEAVKEMLTEIALIIQKALEDKHELCLFHESGSVYIENTLAQWVDTYEFIRDLEDDQRIILRYLDVIHLLINLNREQLVANKDFGATFGSPHFYYQYKQDLASTLNKIKRYQPTLDMEAISNLES